MGFCFPMVASRWLGRAKTFEMGAFGGWEGWRRVGRCSEGGRGLWNLEEIFQKECSGGRISQQPWGFALCAEASGIMCGSNSITSRRGPASAASRPGSMLCGSKNNTSRRRGPARLRRGRLVTGELNLCSSDITGLPWSVEGGYSPKSRSCASRTASPAAHGPARLQGDRGLPEATSCATRTSPAVHGHARPWRGTRSVDRVVTGEAASCATRTTITGRPWTRDCVGAPPSINRLVTAETTFPSRNDDPFT